MENSILKQNKCAWDAIADDWFGTTALPVYGELIPTEERLHLFGDIEGKKVLDVGCGSGHSLRYMGERGASELWGLDISTKQIENATEFLKESGFSPILFNSPMEVNPGIPTEYFDVVYSIYAIGWTVDIEKTFALLASYLKKDGIIIFSWDHPLVSCVSVEDNILVFDGNYFEKEPFRFLKGGKELFTYNRRLSGYVNALAKAGFAIEKLVEETDFDAVKNAGAVRSKYYSTLKAEKLPLSFIIKARKL